jgi:hypothetical protein
MTVKISFRVLRVEGAQGEATSKYLNPDRAGAVRRSCEALKIDASYFLLFEA